jgi:hypothetical protein
VWLENPFGDPALHDVANQPVQRGQQLGIAAGPSLGQMLVVEAQGAIEAVLGARFRLCADPVDYQVHRGG